MTKSSRLLLSALGVILAVALLYLVTSAILTLRHVNLARTSLGRIRQLANEGSLLASQQRWDDLLSEADRLEREARAVAGSARPFLVLSPLLRWVPTHGGDIAAAPALVRLSTHLMTAANEGLDILSEARPILTAHSTGATDSQRALTEDLVTLLDAQQERVAYVSDLMDQADLVRQEIDISSLSPQLAGVVSLLDANLPTLRAACHLLSVTPGLLGSDGRRVYLLLAQNSEELRATGGFISGVGEIAFERGRLVSLRFMDSYAVDNLEKAHPAAPAALTRHMQAEYLVLRDANWTPDFRSSAQVIGSLYNLDQGVSPDGVVACDLKTVGLLVAAMGSLQVEGYQELVTTDNFMDMLTAYWQSPAASQAGGADGDEWWTHRKDFMGSLLGAALTRLMESPGEVSWLELGFGLRDLLEQKHIMLYLDQPGAAEWLRLAGWDGGIKGVEDDLLMLVDTNVGFNKVNPLIKQEIDYHVWLDGTPRAELRVSYAHQGTQTVSACIHEARYGDNYDDMRQRCYWDYVRLYLPAGAQVREIRGFEAGSEEPVSVEGDKVAVAGLLVLPPSAQKTVQVIFELPSASYGDGRYVLDVVKQAGTDDIRLNVVVEDLNCRRGLTADAPAALEGGTWIRLATDLHIDRRLTVRCR